MSKNDLYYLHTIHRRLLEFQKVCIDDVNLGSEALSDEIDWLDCFIDKHERRKK